MYHKIPDGGSVKAVIAFPPVPSKVDRIGKLHVSVEWFDGERRRKEEFTLSDVPVH
jgi:hypothetical protein